MSFEWIFEAEMVQQYWQTKILKWNSYYTLLFFSYNFSWHYLVFYFIQNKGTVQLRGQYIRSKCWCSASQVVHIVHDLCCFVVLTIVSDGALNRTTVHYDDVIMGTIPSQVTSLTIVYSTVYSGADQRKHQSSASLAFVRGIHRGLVNFPRTKGQYRGKCFHLMTSSWTVLVLTPEYSLRTRSIL